MGSSARRPRQRTRGLVRARGCRKAGFAGVRVERPNLELFAREAGVPKEPLSLYSGRGGQLLLARKS